MSDITVLEIKIDNIASDVKDIKTDLETIEDVQDAMSATVDHIEQWRRGNGAKGAELRLQEVEKTTMEVKNCMERVASDERIEQIAAAAVKGIVGNAKLRDKTFVAKLQSIGPIFLGVAAVITAIAAVLK